jgi:peptidoglycan/xylan/chitin deacetylase (PgdA/CDA1 family)
MTPVLHVVTYHYVRDLPNTPFPRIKGMLVRDFRHQLATFQSIYEMATLESALDFLRGAYKPSRDLCLLTFDDGLKEHYSVVTPILADRGIQGIFFPITSCLGEHRVAPVHMNHFLLASLDFELYQRSFLERLNARHLLAPTQIDQEAAQRTSRWDSPQVALFKYLFNFVLDYGVRDQVVKELFEEHIAEEKSFSDILYLNWEEAKQMQEMGMVIGGHSHQHRPLAGLSDEELRRDLCTCWRLLIGHLQTQPFWPFSYPYGEKESFSDTVVRSVRELGFACSFTIEVGTNAPGMDRFALCRLDCKEAPPSITPGSRLDLRTVGNPTHEVMREDERSR